MGLLDGTLRSVFGSAFSPFFLAGNIFVPSQIRGEGDRITEVFGAAIACKVMRSKCTTAMRADSAYTSKDIGLIILQASVNGAIEELSADAEIEVAIIGGVDRYRIGTPIDVDPAQATWECRATPIQSVARPA